MPQAQDRPGRLLGEAAAAPKTSAHNMGLFISPGHLPRCLPALLGTEAELCWTAASRPRGRGCRCHVTPNAVPRGPRARPGARCARCCTNMGEVIGPAHAACQELHKRASLSPGNKSYP